MTAPGNGLGDDWYGFVGRCTAEAILRLASKVGHDAFMLMEDGSPDGFYLVDISNAPLTMEATSTSGRVRWLPGIAGTRDTAPSPFDDDDRHAIYEKVAHLFEPESFGPRLIRPWEDA